jgi:ribosomal protein S27E
MNICEICRETLLGNFCRKDGGKAIPNPDAVRCPKCGVDVTPYEPIEESKFCFCCGWELAKPVPKAPNLKDWFPVFKKWIGMR